MNHPKKQIDPIPNEFNSYEEAAEFWDTHDTTDYPEAFETVDVETEFKGRRYEVEIEEELIKILQVRAKQLGLTVDRLANDMLRQQVIAQ